MLIWIMLTGSMWPAASSPQNQNSINEYKEFTFSLRIKQEFRENNEMNKIKQERNKKGNRYLKLFVSF